MVRPVGPAMILPMRVLTTPMVMPLDRGLAAGDGVTPYEGVDCTGGVALGATAYGVLLVPQAAATTAAAMRPIGLTNLLNISRLLLLTRQRDTCEKESHSRASYSV